MGPTAEHRELVLGFVLEAVEDFVDRICDEFFPTAKSHAMGGSVLGLEGSRREGQVSWHRSTKKARGQKPRLSLPWRGLSGAVVQRWREGHIWRYAWHLITGP